MGLSVTMRRFPAVCCSTRGKGDTFTIDLNNDGTYGNVAVSPSVDAPAIA